MTEAEASYYAKFRCAIALAWIDGSFDAKRREALVNFIENAPRLSEQQKKQLFAEIHKKIPFEETWRQVTDLYDRAHLLDMADVIFKADGDYNEARKKCYGKMQSEHFAAIGHDTLTTSFGAGMTKAPERENA